MRQQQEIALRGHRHDREDVVVQVALQREIDRDRAGHRHGRGEHRDRQREGEHARDRDHQQHHEQHEGAGAFDHADRLHQVEHPGEAEEQVEQHEAQPPGLQVHLERRQRQELAAFGDDDGVDQQHARGPDAGGGGPGPQARQEAHGRDQKQHDQRGGQAVLGEQPHHFVVEGRAGAGGRGQPVAGVAHALGGHPPPLGGSLLALVARVTGGHTRT